MTTQPTSPVAEKSRKQLNNVWNKFLESQERDLVKLYLDVSNLFDNLQAETIKQVREEINDEIEQVLQNIINNDKTPRYPYNGNKEKRKNAMGELPSGGRWWTPAEIAENYLGYRRN